MIYTLKTTMGEFEGLHEALDKARANAKEIKVSREALVHLLMDHSKLQGIHRGEDSDKVKEP